MPPPPGPPLIELPEIVLPVIVSGPLLLIPPPKLPELPEIVDPEIVSVSGLGLKIPPAP